MVFQSFESLEVWRRASRLAVDTYKALENCRDYGLKDQMTRAAVSVPSNIAEGYDRGTNKEFIRFLNIAKGSTAELRTQFYIAQEIGILERESVQYLVNETREISAMIQSLKKSRAARTAEAKEDYNEH